MEVLGAKQMAKIRSNHKHHQQLKQRPIKANFLEFLFYFFIDDTEITNLIWFLLASAESEFASFPQHFVSFLVYEMKEKNEIEGGEGKEVVKIKKL